MKKGKMKLCGLFVYHVFFHNMRKNFKQKIRHICTVVFVLES